MIEAVQSLSSNYDNRVNKNPVPVFKGEKVVNTTLSQPEADVYQSQNGKKDNTLKYAVGLGSLAVVIGLGIAGYKGKLGKTIQKWLGGAEKAVEKDAGNAAKGAEKAASSAAANKLIKFSEEEMKAISGKAVKDLSDEEFTKLVNTVLPEDMTAVRQLLDKAGFLNKNGSEFNGETVGSIIKDFNDKFSKLSSVADSVPKVKQTLNMLTGKDSFLLKKIKDVTVGDVKPFIENLSELKNVAAKGNIDIGNIDIDEGLISMLNSLDPSMKLEKIEEMIGQKININHDKTFVDLIAQIIRINK